MELLVTAAAFVIGSMADPILAVLGIASGIAWARREAGWALIIGVLAWVAILVILALAGRKIGIDVALAKAVALAVWAVIAWIGGRLMVRAG